MIILFEVFIGAAGFVKRKELGDALDHGFNQTLTRYEDNKLAWKLLQLEVKFEKFIWFFSCVSNNYRILIVAVYVLWYQRSR